MRRAEVEPSHFGAGVAIQNIVVARRSTFTDFHCRMRLHTELETVLGMSPVGRQREVRVGYHRPREEESETKEDRVKKGVSHIQPGISAVYGRLAVVVAVAVDVATEAFRAKYAWEILGNLNIGRLSAIRIFPVTLQHDPVTK